MEDAIDKRISELKSNLLKLSEQYKNAVNDTKKIAIEIIKTQSALNELSKIKGDTDG